MKESINTDRLVRGMVSGRWFNPRTGHSIPFEPRHNQLSYRAADAMALAYAGNTARVPKRIGFLYGSSADPAGISSPSDRDLTWSGLSSEVVRIGGSNILVAQFSLPPTISVDDEPSNDRDRYSGNAVTFHAHTRSGSAGEYAFPTSGSSYAGEFSDDMTLYHAILLGEDPSNAKAYIPLARVSLAVDGAYRQKPKDYELALDWKVTFF